MMNKKANNHRIKQGVIDMIIEGKETLPPKQRKLCNFIVENYDKISLYTVERLAKEADVGTTTVMRTVKSLNYNSFNDLKKDLHQSTVEMGLKTWWHLQKSFTHEKGIANESVAKVWEEINNLLGRTLNESFLKNINSTVDLMLNANKINILGLRSSKVAANYFGHLLEGFSTKIKQLSNDPDFLYDRLLQLKKDDILFVFVHSPHTKLTIEAAKFCYNRGIKIILITDLLSCPIIPYAYIVLKVATSNLQYSIVPAITLVETLVIEFGRRTSDESIEHLEKLGELLIEKNVTDSQST